ncbi:MAG: PDZ domain-containing protein [bacterium]|nr:PDZ domain-containing protein [bacterium]
MKSHKRLISLVLVITAIGFLFNCVKEKEKGYLIGIVVPIGKGTVIAKEGYVTVSKTDGVDSPYLISGVYMDSPAYKAGLRPDDIILQIDGEDLLGLKHNYVYKELILGKPGTDIRFLIERQGKQMIFVVTRGK